MNKLNCLRQLTMVFFISFSCYFNALTAQISVAGSIAGRTYNDNNNNGFFDTGDTPATGLTITLCDANFVTITTQAVDGNGQYSFGNLSSATYNVKFPTLSGDKPLTTASPINVILGNGENITDVNAGFYLAATPPSAGSIAGRTYNDNNNNGFFDTGDTPATGLTITLCDADFITITTQAGDGNGQYSFGNLSAATYNVKFPTLSGDKPLTTASPINVILGNGDNITDVNAGYFKQTVPSCSFNIDENQCYRLTTKNNPNILGVDFMSSYFTGLLTMIQTTISTDLSQVYKFTTVSPGVYKIIEQKNGKALTLGTYSCNIGAPLILLNYSGSTNQQWKLECVENGYFKLISIVCPNQVIDLGNGSNYSGRLASLANYSGKDSQKWQAAQVPCSNPCLADVTPPTIKCPDNITKDATGLAGNCWNLTYPMASATDECSKPFVIFLSGIQSGNCFPVGKNTVSFLAVDAKGNSSQCSFTIEIKASTPICQPNFYPSKCYRIVNVNSGKALDINSIAMGKKNKVIQRTYNNGSNQQVNLIGVGYGYFAILFKNSYKFLSNDNTTDEDCYANNYSSSGNTDWKIECNSDGTYRIIHKSSGKVLEVKYDSKKDESQIQIKKWKGSDAQKWRIEEVPCNALSYGLASSEVLTLNAHAELKRARIEWVSSTSYKNDYYTVQKMSDNTGDFEDLEVIKAPIKTDELQHFSTYDTHPTEGGNFYRIKVSQLDGSVKFSDTKKVVFGKMSGVNIFPNPSSEYVDIDLLLYKGQTVNIYLYNTVGHQVALKTVENVGETPVRLDISSYMAGNFLLRITAKGKRDVTQQVIIGR